VKFTSFPFGSLAAMLPKGYVCNSLELGCQAPYPVQTCTSTLLHLQAECTLD